MRESIGVGDGRQSHFEFATGWPEIKPGTVRIYVGRPEVGWTLVGIDAPNDEVIQPLKYTGLLRNPNNQRLGGLHHTLGKVWLALLKPVSSGDTLQIEYEYRPLEPPKPTPFVRCEITPSKTSPNRMAILVQRLGGPEEILHLEGSPEMLREVMYYYHRKLREPPMTKGTV